MVEIRCAAVKSLEGYFLSRRVSTTTGASNAGHSLDIDSLQRERQRRHQKPRLLIAAMDGPRVRSS